MRFGSWPKAWLVVVLTCALARAADDQTTNAGFKAEKVKPKTASAIVSAVGDALPGFRLRAVSDDTVVFSWDKGVARENIEACQSLIHQIEANLPVPPVLANESHVFQLSNQRNASAVAPALKDTVKGLIPNAVGDDLVVVPAVDTDSQVMEIKRVAALLDVARAQMDLHLISAQVSSDKSSVTDEAAEKIRRAIDSYNTLLMAALDRGWYWLAANNSASGAPTGAFDPQFYNYVSMEFALDPAAKKAVCAPDTVAGKDGVPVYANSIRGFADSRYCLGYRDAFHVTHISLSKLIFLLAASADPAKAAESVTKEMSQAGLDANATLANCAQADEKLLQEQPGFKSGKLEESGNMEPAFVCFQHQLGESLRPTRLPELRTALADFLFNYKMATQYPHSFVPYDLQRSADQLNTELEPLVNAFNRDVRAYLEMVERHISHAATGSFKVSFASSGVITVRATSGSEAKSTVNTANTFESPSSPTVNDLAAAFLDAEKNIPDVAKANLTTHAAQALIAGLNVSKGRLIKLGRSFDVTVTPAEVSDGSAADLTINLTANDSPEATSGFNSIITDKSSADDTNRVSRHTVSTKIRVPALRIFDISTFSAALARRKTSIPLLPPLLEVPYVGNFLRLPLGTSTAYHRSLVIGAAIIVPTASDIAHSMPFTGDRIIAQKDGGTSLTRAGDGNGILAFVRPFHQALMACWIEPFVGASAGFAADLEKKTPAYQSIKMQSCESLRFGSQLADSH